MSKRVRFAGVHIVFNFTVEDEDGDVTPLSTQAQAIGAKEWRTSWETEASAAFRASVLAQLEAPDEPAPEPASNGNGNRAQRRQMARKKIG